MDRRNFIAGCLGLPLLAQAGGSQAQAGLTKMIFPFAAGAGGDTLCRLIAQEMAPALQRTIVVENRTGGDGLIGIKAVKGASADGSMVLVTTGPTMYLLPMVETTPSFDTARDFVPVSLLARFEFALVIGPGIDATDFKSFVAWLKAHPDKTSFGVPSNGTIPHFAGSKLEKDLGIPLSRVPYRGSAPILNDLVGGHLPFGITTLADALPQHRAKGVKIIAVASAERSPFAPEVPTLKESGIDLVADAWYGMWLPAGSPPDFAGKLGAAASAALARPEVKEKLTAIGLIPVGSTADGLTKELAANTAFWQPIVKATGYKIEN
ncbi:tripartite-type tricarboxylate transporter receptor subunit TctC [Bradyrhizobium barranii subsp. barranii]|uniref:Bug family tripartite tricarboxylate transporter substrate binding protein n=1 Tax=Bradyrhizobium TaxID=374 RepID=UPI0003F9FF19|nr:MULTISPECIES: Bug family tripartite tricarboxylate transporter substrate binding protein [Bradyrhizobium]MBR0883107.1 Bug family tripartite tricarboxylate transporter substrate binding protein [Bradyrhizobium liaoningense]MBR0999286.1 Bug family tripartite tricarboxylate transporter substrate binding protein [Bradyrhizobium liaoningense]MBR1069500.1 Bug family tripartite tricarboxylate transporter substrate binding protein [Bradyrhizobium liaoningense]MCP1747028.1 tripartite-type tricarboxyl